MSIDRLAQQLQAGFLVYRQLMSDELRKSPDKDPRVIKEMHGRLKDYWGVIFTPNIEDGFRIQASDLDREFTRVAAGKYSGTLDKQINQVSDKAFQQAYRAGLNKGWERAEAWDKASNAWGLDPARMRRWIVGAPGPSDNLYDTRMHTGGEGALSSMIESRAKIIGDHEAHTIVHLGQQAEWKQKQDAGYLPKDAVKRFVTAQDELVCNICGPLNNRTIPLDQTFKGFFMPPMHINCRCTVVIDDPSVSKMAQQRQRAQPPEEVEAPKQVPTYGPPARKPRKYGAPVTRSAPKLQKKPSVIAAETDAKRRADEAKRRAQANQVRVAKPAAPKTEQAPKAQKIATKAPATKQEGKMQWAFPELHNKPEVAPRKTVFDSEKKKLRRKIGAEAPKDKKRKIRTGKTSPHRRGQGVPRGAKTGSGTKRVGDHSQDQKNTDLADQENDKLDTSGLHFDLPDRPNTWVIDPKTKKRVHPS